MVPSLCGCRSDLMGDSCKQLSEKIDDDTLKCRHSNIKYKLVWFCFLFLKQQATCFSYVEVYFLFY